MKTNRGLQCHDCGSTQVAINADTWVIPMRDGTTKIAGDHEWNKTSPATCLRCDCEGPVEDFTPPPISAKELAPGEAGLLIGITCLFALGFAALANTVAKT